MPTLSISVSYDSPAELVDALEELRHLWDSFEDGAVDLGPLLRATLRELDAAGHAAVSEGATAS
jgi:hypothetical protein